MGRNSEDLRELPDIQKPLLLFKNLKTDLDKLKSQIHNLKNIKLSSKLLKGNKFEKKGDIPSGKETGIHRKQAQPKSEKYTGKRNIGTSAHKHANDSKSRLELVEMFLQETESSSLPIYQRCFPVSHASKLRVP